MSRRLTTCTTPGCYELTEGGKCDDCRVEARRASDARRPSARRRGYDSRWERTRRQFLRDNPICQDDSGCQALATDVDHIDGLGPRGPRGHDFTNLRALCHSHHSQRTSRDQPGGWNA